MISTTDTSSIGAPVWFISGCSTGLGRAIGRAVIARGWNVVLTARDPTSLEDLRAEGGDRALALRLDVTSADQIISAVDRAEARFGRIDVLVNNGGYGYASVVELAQDAQVRALFETNVFGLIRLTQAVLPGMRQRRRGHVINIGSIAGVISGASSGFYSATKHAVEAVTEALAAEGAGLNIKATVVEPATFSTDFISRSLKSTPVTVPEYQESVRAFTHQADALVKDRRPGDPAKGAAAILDCTLLDHPPLRLPLGMDACPRLEEAIRHRLAELDAWRDVAAAAAG